MTVVGLAALLLAPLSFLSARVATARGALTSRAVIIPRLVREPRILPLVEVTGVGLRYRPGNNAVAWGLYVWPTSGPPVRVSVRAPNHPEPPGRSNVSRARRHLRRPAGYVPALDWDYLAASDAGRAASAIYAQTLLVQGDAGPLVAQAQQRRSSTGSGSATAYWSPDGTTGPLPAR